MAMGFFKVKLGVAMMQVIVRMTGNRGQYAGEVLFTPYFAVRESSV